MTRAFIAIRPPEPVLDAIAARVAAVAMPNARPTPREHWHLTLQFLGDDADVSDVEAALAPEPLDVGEGAGRIRLGGPETLGNPRRARVLALGLHEGARWTAELAALVERRLAPLGYAREDREPRLRRAPHPRTVSRWPTDVRTLRTAIGAEPVGPAWTVDEIVLFESRLRPQGAEQWCGRGYRRIGGRAESETTRSRLGIGTGCTVDPHGGSVGRAPQRRSSSSHGDDRRPGRLRCR